MQSFACRLSHAIRMARLAFGKRLRGEIIAPRAVATLQPPIAFDIATMLIEPTSTMDMPASRRVCLSSSPAPAQMASHPFNGESP